MSDSPLDLDLKLLPDWLKEPEGKNPYADYPGEPAGRGFREGGRRGEGRPGGRPGSRPDSRERGARPGRGAPGRSEGGPGRRDREGGRGGSPNRPFRGREGAPGPGRRPERGGQRQHPRGETREPRESAPEAAVPLEVVILPEPDAVAALVQQIRTSHRAYPLYGLGRMFLNKPERHRVRITSLAPAYPLYQVGGEGGGVTFNRRQAQKEAFRAALETHYTRETRESEPPKGNFTNVARCRISGTLLGPTNHHGYQLALRRLYEARFARRSDFQEFLRQIEVVNDPEVIESWKKEVSTTTLYRTSREEEPVEFQTLEAVEAHFTAHYLDQCLSAAKTIEISGSASRNLQDRVLREAVRAAWEKERTFPAQLVARLRPPFQEAALSVWKHRKRMLYVSAVRPVRFGAEARSVSEEIGGILNVIESKPKCTRADLSAHLLKPYEGDESHARRKTALATDFHWLIHSGHIIEFHDGTLDLPLAPKEAAREAAAGEGEPSPEKADEAGAVANQAEPSAPAAEAVAETAPAPEAVADPVQPPEPTTVPTPEASAAPASEEAPVGS